jgi:hypothetical protein
LASRGGLDEFREGFHLRSSRKKYDKNPIKTDKNPRKTLKELNNLREMIEKKDI